MVMSIDPIPPLLPTSPRARRPRPSRLFLRLGVMAALLCPSAGPAQVTPPADRLTLPAETAQQLVRQTVTNAIGVFRQHNLKSDEIAVTLLDLNAPQPSAVSFR